MVLILAELWGTLPVPLYAVLPLGIVSCPQEGVLVIAEDKRSSPPAISRRASTASPPRRGGEGRDGSRRALGRSPRSLVGALQ